MMKETNIFIKLRNMTEKSVLFLQKRIVLQKASVFQPENIHIEIKLNVDGFSRSNTVMAETGIAGLCRKVDIGIGCFNAK